MKIEAYGNYDEGFVVMSDPDDVMSRKEIKRLFKKLYSNDKIERKILFNIDYDESKDLYPDNKLNIDEILSYKSLFFTTNENHNCDDMTFSFMYEDYRVFGMAFKNAANPEIFAKLDDELKEEDLSNFAECVYSDCKENPDYGCNKDSELFYVTPRV